MILLEKIAGRVANKKYDPYDFVWIVFDRDGHENVSDTFEHALEKLSLLAILYKTIIVNQVSKYGTANLRF